MSVFLIGHFGAHAIFWLLWRYFDDPASMFAIAGMLLISPFQLIASLRRLRALR